MKKTWLTLFLTAALSASPAMADDLAKFIGI